MSRCSFRVPTVLLLVLKSMMQFVDWIDNALVGRCVRCIAFGQSVVFKQVHLGLRPQVVDWLIAIALATKTSKQGPLRMLLLQQLLL